MLLIFMYLITIMRVAQLGAFNQEEACVRREGKGWVLVVDLSVCSTRGRSLLSLNNPPVLPNSYATPPKVSYLLGKSILTFQMKDKGKWLSKTLCLF